MAKGKIEQLGEKAQSKAIKLNVEGLSNSSIADELNKEFNSEINSNEVMKFIQRSRSKSIKLLKEDKNFQSKLVEQYFDTIKQLKELNGEIWKFFYELRKNPEYKDKIITCTKCHHRMILQLQSYGLLLKTADTILKQIEHVDTVLGRLKKQSMNITYNYTDLSKKIGIVLPNLLYSMEKRGIIKLNKKRLKLYTGGVKKMVDEDEEDDIDDIPEEEEIPAE